MLDTRSRSNHPSARRFAFASRRVEVEEKLPITDEARNNLSSFGIGLIGALVAAAVIAAAKLILL
jgi:hypothetical protein